MFDLQGNTYRLFHPHEPAGGEAGFLPQVWSPNAQPLLVVDPNAETGIRPTLYKLITSQVEASPLPDGAIPLAWVQ